MIADITLWHSKSCSPIGTVTAECLHLLLMQKYIILATAEAAVANQAECAMRTGESSFVLLTQKHIILADEEAAAARAEATAARADAAMARADAASMHKVCPLLHASYKRSLRRGSSHSSKGVAREHARPSPEWARPSEGSADEAVGQQQSCNYCTPKHLISCSNLCLRRAAAPAIWIYNGFQMSTC